MTILRVVSANDKETEVSMSTALDAIVRECLITNPSVVMISWEAKGTLISRTLPDSLILQEGFARKIHAAILGFDSDAEN